MQYVCEAVNFSFSKHYIQTFKFPCSKLIKKCKKFIQKMQKKLTVLTFLQDASLISLNSSITHKPHTFSTIAQLAHGELFK